MREIYYFLGFCFVFLSRIISFIKLSKAVFGGEVIHISIGLKYTKKLLILKDIKRQ